MLKLIFRTLQDRNHFPGLQILQKNFGTFQEAWEPCLSDIQLTYATVCAVMHTIHSLTMYVQCLQHQSDMLPSLPHQWW